MKTRMTFLAGAALLALTVQSVAQTSAAPKIGVMDVLRAILECQEGKIANADFQRKYEAKRDELQKKQKELDDLQQQLRSNTLSNEARAGLSRNVDSRTTELQRAQEDAEKEFNGLRNDIFNRIGAKLAPVVQQYAKENHFTLVLDSSSQTNQISFSDPALDVTDDVIKRFDAAQVSSAGAPAAPAKPPSSSPGSKPAATTGKGTTTTPAPSAAQKKN